MSSSEAEFDDETNDNADEASAEEEYGDGSGSENENNEGNGVADDDSNEDSDDDVPLSTLNRGAKKAENDDEEKEYDSGEDSERPNRKKSTTKRKSRSRSSTSKRKRGSSDDDSMDDFIDDVGSVDSEATYSDVDSTPKKKETSVKKKKKTPVSKKKKKESAKKKKSSSAKKKKSAPTPLPSAATAPRQSVPTPSSELYSKTAKGILIQQFLCRWWYVLTWPDPAALPESPPLNYDSLDGLPGVYICTSGDDIGKLVDLRDRSTAPCFVNMSHKPAGEVRDLLLAALEEQEKVLKEHGAGGLGDEEGEKKIKELRKWAKKVNPEKADREARNALKGAGMKLTEMPPAVVSSEAMF